MLRKDRSLIKMYKDLMVTKRDLVDLRESITNTIQSIRESDEQMKKIDMRRKARRETEQCQPVLKPSLKGHALGSCCQLCFASFRERDTLELHLQERHAVCKQCGERAKAQIEDHHLFQCGQAKIACEICSQQVKMMSYDEHFKVCSFRQCYKCKKDVATRTYAFHLYQCKGRLNAAAEVLPSRQPIKARQRDRPQAIPCCFVRF